MRRLVLIGLAGIALAGGAADAEAQDGRIRTSTPAPDATPRVTPPTAAPAPTFALRSQDDDAVRPTYVVLPSEANRPDPAAPAGAVAAAVPAQLAEARAVPADAPAPDAAKAAAETAPWCRSRKVVGTGAGFCLIN